MKESLEVGHDIIEVERIRRAHERHGDLFLQKIFVEEEIAYALSYSNPYPYLAARFAAKEAGSKALGSGIGKRVGWKDLFVRKDPSGKPSLQMSERAKANFPSGTFSLSITHTRTLASAFVIWSS